MTVGTGSTKTEDVKLCGEGEASLLSLLSPEYRGMRDGREMEESISGHHATERIIVNGLTNSVRLKTGGRGAENKKREETLVP